MEGSQKPTSVVDGGGTLLSIGDFYDNSSSGLAATNVQSAIDEIAGSSVTTLHASLTDLATSGHPASVIDVAGTALDTYLTSLNTDITFVSSDNVVWVDQVKDEVAGERYKTIQAAINYINTQTPIITDQWAIRLGSGAYSEDIQIPSYIRLYGNSLSTILTGKIAGGTLGTDYSEFFIKDCVLQSLIVGSYASAVGSVDLSAGFDWATTPQKFQINMALTLYDVNLTANCTTLQEVINHINYAFASDNGYGDMSAVYEAYDAGSNHVGIRNLSGAANFLLAVGTPDALATFGIAANTYGITSGILSLDNCSITGGTCVGAASILILTNSSVAGGDLSSLSTVIALRSSLNAGTFPSSISIYNSYLDNAIFSGGEFFNSTIGSSNTINAGNYQFYNCAILKTLILTSGTIKLYTSNASNITLNGGTLETYRSFISSFTNTSGSWINKDLQVNVDSALGIYIGDTNTDSSWRMIISGNNFLTQRREGGSWVTKNTITP